jgi:Mor family transcriptional regulator
MDKRQDIVTEMMSEVRSLLGGAIVSPRAEQALEARLRLNWGGQLVYVKKTAVDAEARAAAIRARYNQANRQELMQEFGISRAQFYRILRG